MNGAREKQSAPIKPAGFAVTGILAVVILLVGSGLAWWSAHRADQAMRKDLLRRGRQVANTLDRRQVFALQGAEADLNAPAYLQLQHHLDIARRAQEDCVYIYLMARSANGDIIFLLDVQEDNPNDPPCVPGEEYEEASDELRSLFAEGKPLVEGPLPDEWGVWISPLIPITDPETGDVAVLGMDFDVRDWYRHIVQAATPPLLIAMALVLMMSAGVAVARLRDATVSAALLWSAGLLVLVLLLALFPARYLTVRRARAQRQESMRTLVNAVKPGFNRVMRILQSMAGQPAALQVVSGVAPPDNREILAVLETVRAACDASIVYLMDTNGLTTACTPYTEHGQQQTLTGKNYAFRPYFSKPMADGMPTAYGALGVTTGHRGIYVSVPVYRREMNGIAGVAVAKLGLSSIDAALHAVNEQCFVLSPGGIVFAANRTNRLFRTAYPMDAARRRALVDARQFGDHSLDPLSMDLSAAQVAVQGQDYHITRMPLMGGGWELVRLSPRTFIDINALAQVFLLCTVVLGGIVFTVVYLLARRRHQRALEQKNAELSVNRERLELAMDAAEHGFWDWNLQTDGIYFSPRYYTMLGYEPGELPMSRDTWLGLMHPADREVVVPEIQRHVEQAEPYEVEFRLRCKDGSWKWISGQGRSFDMSRTGVPTRAVGVHVDINERKRNEQRMSETLDALKSSRIKLMSMMEDAEAARKTATEAQRLFERLFRGNPALMALTTLPEQEFLEVNDAFIEILGYSRDEIIGRTAGEIGLFPNSEEQEKASGQLQREGRIVDSELQVRCRDGSLRYGLFSGERIQRRDQECFLTVMVDITERKQTEDALHEMNAALQEATARANAMAAQAEMANAAKSEFLANMSHEIRTPMNGVIGMTGLLLDTTLDEEQRTYAQTIRSSGEALMLLINDILDFSKIEAGKMDLEQLDFDLLHLLDDFADTVAVRAQEKELEFICDVAPDVPVNLRGDPGRLRQVLANLAGNAVKFTDQGEIVVQVTRCTDRQPETEHRQPHTGTGSPVMLHFSVRDTGIGIPRNRLGMLFNKFSQVDSSTSRKYGGTGLGLAISKKLVEMMGGEIGVISPASGSGGEEARSGTSIPDRADTPPHAQPQNPGSEFWFTVRLERHPASDELEERRVADMEGVRALVVDDSATNRRKLSARLKAWGMRTAEAKDGPAALQALYRALDEQDPFRLALLDMQMPEMDGEDLGRAIKTDQRLHETRLILLTSLGTHGMNAHLADLGFASALSKPVRHGELRKVIRRVLKRTDETGAARADHDGETMRTRAEASRSDYKHARVLLVEDNAVNQKVVSGILRKLGISADTAANGLEAVAAAESSAYDLIFMDVQMPEMDGYEATRRIRRMEAARKQDHGRTEDDASFRSGVPIIAITAHAMDGDREQCMQAGMNDYIPKPIEPKRLAEMLAKWLPAQVPEDRGRKTEDGRRKEEEDRLVNGPQAKGREPNTANRASRSVWDRTQLLERALGDEELVRHIMERFREDMPRQAELLQQALETGDEDAVVMHAHSIKGSAANVSAEALSKIAGEIEMAGRRGDLQAVSSRMDTLRNRFETLQKAITGSGNDAQ